MNRARVTLVFTHWGGDVERTVLGTVYSQAEADRLIAPHRARIAALDHPGPFWKFEIQELVETPQHPGPEQEQVAEDDQQERVRNVGPRRD